MNANNIWSKAKQVQIHTLPNITGNFNIGFDKHIPEETKKELIGFVNWVECNFHLPITLWVEFEYKHYLVDCSGNRVGYLFYWVDFTGYPVFENEDDIPMIRLPVRTEHCSICEILTSFIEAITCYFAWITNCMSEDYAPGENDVEEILQAYLSARSNRIPYI